VPKSPIAWWAPNIITDARGRRQDGEEPQVFQLNASSFAIGNFVGQGRDIRFCGLSWAVIEESNTNRDDFRNSVESYDECADRIMKRLQGRRPTEWYTIAVVSLFLVWIEILMAFMLAFYTPTIGLGCWSASFALYGILSTLSWIVQFCKIPSDRTRAVCHFFNFLACGWLIVTTFFIVSTVSSMFY
jgi:hypothetical protein